MARIYWPLTLGLTKKLAKRLSAKMNTALKSEIQYSLNSPLCPMRRPEQVSLRLKERILSAFTEASCLMEALKPVMVRAWFTTHCRSRSHKLGCALFHITVIRVPGF